MSLNLKARVTPFVGDNERAKAVNSVSADIGVRPASFTTFAYFSTTALGACYK